MPKLKNFRKHLIILGLAALCFFAAYGIINQNQPSPISDADHQTLTCSDNTCSNLQTLIDSVADGHSHTIQIGSSSETGTTLEIAEGETIDCGTNKTITLEVFNEIDMDNGSSSSQVATLKNCTIKKTADGINNSNGDLISANKNVLIENNNLYTASTSGDHDAYEAHINIESSSGDHRNIKIKDNNFYIQTYSNDYVNNNIYIGLSSDTADTSNEDNMILISGNTSNNIRIEAQAINTKSQTHHKIINNNFTNSGTDSNIGLNLQQNTSVLFQNNTLDNFKWGLVTNQNGTSGTIKGNVFNNRTYDVQRPIQTFMYRNFLSYVHVLMIL